MSPTLMGLATAFSWGTADFIARFTGRRYGHLVALAGMLATSAVILSGIALAMDLAWRWPLHGWWQILIAGLGVAVGTMLLYWGLVRGPVSVVAPITGSYPAFNLVLDVALGVRPSALQWAMMLLVMTGVLVIARASRSFESETEYHPAALRRTILIAIGGAIVFAGTLAALREAAATYGELQSVVMGRWIGTVFALGVVLILQREGLRAVSGTWWLILSGQGMLDALAYVSLAIGTQHERGVIAVVVASTFSAVTVVLARLVLREAMTAAQWLGIAMIVAGVAVLSAL